MRRQKRCFNLPPVPATWTRGVPKGTGPLKRRRRTPVERISPLTPLLLTRLVENSPLPLSKLLLTRRKIRTTNEVLGVAEDKGNKVVTPTPLPRMSISFSRRKKKTETYPKSNALTAIGKHITPTSVLRIRRRSQETSDGPGDLHANDCS